MSTPYLNINQKSQSKLNKGGKSSDKKPASFMLTFNNKDRVTPDKTHIDRPKFEIDYGPALGVLNL